MSRVASGGAAAIRNILKENLTDLIKWVGNVKLEGAAFDRMTWISLPDNADKLRYMQAIYTGRGGMWQSWWDSEVGKPPEEWTLPILSAGVNTRVSSPWNNAIHLRNSQDGTTVDQIYLGVRAAPSPRWVMRFDASFPTDIPATDCNVVIGFEIPAQGGHTLAALEIGSTVARLVARYGLPDGTYVSVVGSDISSSVCTGTWQAYHLVLDPPYLSLDINNTTQVSITLPETVTFYPEVIPFFANESSVVIDDVYIGQWAAWHIESRIFPPPREVKTGGLVTVTSDSGGIVLASGEVQSVLVKALSGNSGGIYIGGENYRPYSGYGFLLEPGEAVNLDVDNFNRIYLYAVVSGDIVTYTGVY